MVAEEEGEVVGMAKGELRDGLGHVSFVYLKPEARGLGGGNDSSAISSHTSARKGSSTSR